VLVKGSRGMQMEVIVNAIKAQASSWHSWVFQASFDIPWCLVLNKDINIFRDRVQSWLHNDQKLQCQPASNSESYCRIPATATDMA
jgi:hypothetical protein